MYWKPYLRIIRPVNLLIMAIMLILVRYAIFFPIFKLNGLEGLMPGWQFLLLVMATLFIGAGGYVINDVLDIELDQVNKPGQQIIGRKISEATGNKLHFNLTAAGIIFGLVFSYLSGNIFLAILFVIIPTALFYYSYKYKYMPAIGNLVVALLAAMVVMIYWLFEFYNLRSHADEFIDASLSFPQINRFVLAFAFFAFITTLVREIIKDIQDKEGDARFGCRTLPVVMKPGTVRLVILALIMVTIASVAWFQYILFSTGYIWMAGLLMVTQILMIYSIPVIVKAAEKKDWGRLSMLFKVIMMSGMLTLMATWLKTS